MDMDSVIPENIIKITGHNVIYGAHPIKYYKLIISKKLSPETS
jgi:hypothetical protein